MGIFGKPNIGKLKAKIDVDGLIKACGYKDLLVRRSAAQALGELTEDPAARISWATAKFNKPWEEAPLKRAVERLIKALKDEDEGMRSDAARALGKIKDKRAAEPLLEALKEASKYRDKLLFMNASNALENIALVNIEGVKTLIKALKDEDKLVRDVAANILNLVKSRKEKSADKSSGA